MVRRTAPLAIAVVFLLTAPALAGNGHKCTSSTQNCLDMMAENARNKGLIGVLGEWDHSVGGYRIESFIDGSLAEDVGVRPGDVLVAINGIALDDRDALYADRVNRVPGATAMITLLRDGDRLETSVKLIAMTEEQIAGHVGAHLLHHHAGVGVASAD